MIKSTWIVEPPVIYDPLLSKLNCYVLCLFGEKIIFNHLLGIGLMFLHDALFKWSANRDNYRQNEIAVSKWPNWWCHIYLKTTLTTANMSRSRWSHVTNRHKWLWFNWPLNKELDVSFAALVAILYTAEQWMGLFYGNALERWCIETSPGCVCSLSSHSLSLPAALSSVHVFYVRMIFI